MKGLLVPRTIITALIFGALYSLITAYVGDIAVDYWGRPRGVAYGIFRNYYWVVLTIYGFVMVFVFRVIPIRYALVMFLIVISVPTFLLMPDRGERPILAVYTSAVMMCLAFAACEYYRNKRQKSSV